MKYPRNSFWKSKPGINKLSNREKMNSTGKNLTKANKRDLAVQELQKTEETYVEQLQLLNLVYVTPMENLKSISQEQHNTLFSQIKIILNFNTNFLHNLSDAIKRGNSIGQELLNFCPYFKIYREYVNNYEQANILLRKLKSRQEFIELDEEGRTRCHNLSISDLIVTPIQRVPRYPMLIKEIIKYSEPHHPDLGLLTAALEKYTLLNRHINEGIKEQEKRDKVREIGEKVLEGGKPISLVAPARMFIMQGELWKVCRGKNKKYMFFLFNDLLIYANPQGKYYKLHNKLAINSSFHSELVDEERYPPHSIQISSSTKSFVVFADHQDQCLRWLKAIQDIKEQQEERNKKKGDYARGNDIKKAPVMVPDHFFEHCQVCCVKFTFVKRKHHCRICGKVVCGSCSNGKLHGLNDKLMRACDYCMKEHMSTAQVFKPSKFSPSSQSTFVNDLAAPVLPANDDFKEGTPDISSEILSISFYHGVIATKSERKKILQKKKQGSFFISEADDCLLLVYKPRNDKVEEVRIVAKIVDGSSISYTCDNPRISSSSIEDLVKRKLWKPLGLTKEVAPNQSREKLKSDNSENYGRCVALFDYKSQEPGDLTLKKGDEILILNQSEADGWWTGKIGEKVGLFPVNFTEVIVNSVAKPVQKVNGEQPQGPKGGDIFIAKQDHETKFSGEISFRSGDKIILQKTDQSGWWLGRLESNNQLGWFSPALVEPVRR